MIEIVHPATSDGRQAMLGSTCVASDESCEWARCAKAIVPVIPRSGPVAVLGLGFGIMARLLPMDRLVVFYEKEPAFIESFAFGRKVVEGDFRETLTGKWDTIINETGVKHDLRPFLMPGGLLIGGDDADTV